MIKYGLAHLALDAEGNFHVVYVGIVPEQGGSSIGQSSAKFEDLESALTFMKAVVKKSMKIYKKEIQKRERSK